MNVLVIATHPDDEILGCGGVMARHSTLSHKVQTLVITEGISELFPPEQVHNLRKELRDANRVLGVSNVEFLDFPAPRLDTVPRHKLADSISEVIQSLKPNVIYLPHYGDLHVDHQAVYHATLIACRPINGSPVHRLLCYETLSETEWSPPVGHAAFIPTVFVDITQYVSLKLQAMACYRSQLKQEPHPRSLQGIEALARMRGRTVSLSAAEAFMLVREIVA